MTRAATNPALTNLHALARQIINDEARGPIGTEDNCADLDNLVDLGVELARAVLHQCPPQDFSAWTGTHRVPDEMPT